LELKERILVEVFGIKTEGENLKEPAEKGLRSSLKLGLNKK